MVNEHFDRPPALGSLVGGAPEQILGPEEAGGLFNAGSPDVRDKECLESLASGDDLIFEDLGLTDFLLDDVVFADPEASCTLNNDPLFDLSTEFSTSFLSETMDVSFASQEASTAAAEPCEGQQEATSPEPQSLEHLLDLLITTDNNGSPGQHGQKLPSGSPGQHEQQLPSGFTAVSSDIVSLDVVPSGTVSSGAVFSDIVSTFDGIVSYDGTLNYSESAPCIVSHSLSPGVCSVIPIQAPKDSIVEFNIEEFLTFSNNLDIPLVSGIPLYSPVEAADDVCVSSEVISPQIEVGVISPPTEVSTALSDHMYAKPSEESPPANLGLVDQTAQLGTQPSEAGKVKVTKDQRVQRREKNNVASKVCRASKKSRFRLMEEEIEELEVKNTELRSSNAKMEDINRQLKEAIASAFKCMKTTAGNSS